MQQEFIRNKLKSSASKGCATSYRPLWNKYAVLILTLCSDVRIRFFYALNKIIYLIKIHISIFM
jgi:hypothetical protein